MSGSLRFKSLGKTQLNKLLVAEQHSEEKSVCMRYLIMKNAFTALQRQDDTSQTSPAGCGCSSWHIKLSFLVKSTTLSLRGQCWVSKNMSRSHFIAKTKALQLKHISKQSRFVKTLSLPLYRPGAVKYTHVCVKMPVFAIIHTHSNLDLKRKQIA